MASRSKTQHRQIKPVDLDAIDAVPIEVAVGGKALPLAIGSKVEIEHENAIVRTVVGIKIDVEGHASYCLEWFNGIDFKYDWVSLNELHYMHANMYQRKTVTLS